MKKLVSLFAFVAISCAAFGAVLQTVKNVQPGEVSVGGTGKLTAVDVFSTVQSGTVKIGRVFTMTHFTNAVDTTSEVVTNEVETKVFETVFYRGDGVLFTNITSGVYGNDPGTVCWESSVEGQAAAIWWNDISGWHYSTQFDEAYNQYDWGVQNKRVWKDADYIDFGTGASRVEFSRNEIYNHSTFATNVVTVVTTNSVTPVKAYDLTITNQVLNGTCSGGVYHGVPSDGVWLFNGDKIVFEGTATGGAMRMVIE